uniref:Uncharacterized protein n=1 Tax=Lepeophtheirus salmonis TaxID=72036 RepID=A0A0K2TU91_LEPSM
MIWHIFLDYYNSKMTSQILEPNKFCTGFCTLYSIQRLQTKKLITDS